MGSECPGGNLSLAAQCNQTAYNFHAGCISSFVTENCEELIFGNLCTQLVVTGENAQKQNVTCMSTIVCGKAPSFSNAEAIYTGQDEARFGDTTTVRCRTGYERSDAKGYSATIGCSEDGFSALPAEFGCSPVSCGLYCRTCVGAFTVRGSVGSEGDDRPTSGERILHPYRDSVGFCCGGRSAVLSDSSAYDQPPSGPVEGGTLAGWPQDPGAGFEQVQTQSFGQAPMQITCDAGKELVPGFGTLTPRCLARPECFYDFEATFTRDGASLACGEAETALEIASCWRSEKAETREFCQRLRGVYEAGAVCRVPLVTPTIMYDPESGTPSTCLVDSVGCEFRVKVTVRVFTGESGVALYYSYEANPVSASSAFQVSSPVGSAKKFNADFTILATVEGCNVNPVFRTISLIAVKPGYPNSVLVTSPDLLVTTTSGAIPDGVGRCAAMGVVPLAVAEFDPRGPGCATFRFFAFQPIALAGTLAKGYSLLEFGLWFHQRRVTGGVITSKGIHPASESPRNLDNPDGRAKFYQLDDCPVMVDFKRMVAVDAISLGTSNDCNSRDPVMWKILASPDGYTWIEVEDQATTFPMPRERSVVLPLLPIDLLNPAAVSGFRAAVKSISESINVPSALNTITVSIQLRTLDTDAIMLPPVGTVFRISGLSGGATRADISHPVRSRRMCAGRGEFCTTALLPFGNYEEIGGSRLFLLEATVEQCLEVNDTTIVFSFEVSNPDAARPMPSLSLEASGNLIMPPTPMTGSILRANGIAFFISAALTSTSDVVGFTSTMTLQVELSLRPMTSSRWRLEMLTRAMTLSTNALPVTMTFEDGSVDEMMASWDNSIGTLAFTQTRNSNPKCTLDGRCSRATKVVISFVLINPSDAQYPAPAVLLKGDICPRVTGGCGSDGQYTTLNNILPAGEVLTSTAECPLPLLFDQCGQCGGTDTLCIGCDGVVNSGIVADQCGVCGGRDDCAGCDGIAYSGLQADACGVCDGDNACDSAFVQSDNTYPNILFNVTIKNAPGTTEMLPVHRITIRRVLAELLGIDIRSVDIVSVLDAPGSKGDARRAKLEGLAGGEAVVSGKGDEERVLKSLLGLREGEGVCDRRSVAWSGCEQNVGDWWHQDAESVVVEEEEETGEVPGGWGAGEREEEDEGWQIVGKGERKLLQEGGEIPATGVVDIELRANFLKDKSLDQAALTVMTAILNGTVDSRLSEAGLCDIRGGGCRALLFSPVVVNKVGDPVPLEPAPPPPPESSLPLIISLAVVGGGLIAVGAYFALRFKRGMLARRYAAKFTLTDMMEADERGMLEGLGRNPIGSTFQPPTGWDGESGHGISREASMGPGSFRPSKMSRAGSATVGTPSMSTARSFVSDHDGEILYDPRSDALKAKTSMVRHQSMLRATGSRSSSMGSSMGSFGMEGGGKVSTAAAARAMVLERERGWDSRDGPDGPQSGGSNTGLLRRPSRGSETGGSSIRSSGGSSVGSGVGEMGFEKVRTTATQRFFKTLSTMGSRSGNSIRDGQQSTAPSSVVSAEYTTEGWPPQKEEVQETRLITGRKVLTPLDRAALFDTAFPPMEALANPNAAPKNIFDPTRKIGQGKGSRRVPSNHSRAESRTGSFRTRSIRHAPSSQASTQGGIYPHGGALGRSASGLSAASSGGGDEPVSPKSGGGGGSLRGGQFAPSTAGPASSYGASSGVAASAADRFGDRQNPGPRGNANFKRGTLGSNTYK